MGKDLAKEMSTLSVIQPLSVAIARTRCVLFVPFQLRKWLQWGFAAFLMGTLPSGGFWGRGAPKEVSADLGGHQWGDSNGMDWLQEHLALVLGVVALGVLVVFLLALLFTWLSSRARFMLLDGVVHNRGAIGEPWQAYRREGNSLFRCRFFLGLISTVAVGMIVGVPLLLNLENWRSGVFGVRSFALLLLSGMALLSWLLVMEVISVLLMDFVVPVMYKYHLPVWPAGRRVIQGLVRQHPGSLLLYFLARFLLSSVLATLSMLVIVLTLFLALIPYVGSVIMLPLTVFQITYPLAFLQQLGPEWRLLPLDRSDSLAL